MINSIQYLRGLAAILVVYYHATIKAAQNDFHNSDVFYIGQSGVDLFFIISGFIICFVGDKASFDVLTFLKSRIKRIIPLYWFFTLLALLAYIIVPSLVNNSGGETKIFESIFLIPTKDKYLVQNGWTLSYEFYFYFIFSLVVLLKFSRIWLFSLLCFLPLLNLIHPTFFIFEPYLLEFAMGVLSYEIYKQGVNKRIFYLLLFVILLSIVIIFEGRVLNYGLPMWALFHIGLLINSSLTKLENKRHIAHCCFNFLGASSYSLYLSHVFTLVVLNKLYLAFFGNTHLFLYLGLLCVLSAVVGGFVYKLIEIPLTKLVNNIFIK